MALAGGNAAGVGIVFRRPIGLTEPVGYQSWFILGGSSARLPHRVGASLFTPCTWKLALDWGGIIWNALNALATHAREHGRPFVVMGDWNVGHEQLLEAGWLQRLGLVNLQQVDRTPTCVTPGAATFIDRVYVSQSLLNMFGPVAVDVTAGLATHRPISTSVRRGPTMPAPRTLCTAPRLPAERPLGCVAPPPSYQAVSNLLAQGSLEDVAAAYTSWSGIAESELADTHYDIEVKVGTMGKVPRYEHKQPQYPQYGRPSAGPAARAVRTLASLARHARQVLAASLAQGKANPQAKPLAKGLANAAVACGDLALSRWATAALAVADVTVAHAANGRALQLIDELVAQAEVFCN